MRGGGAIKPLVWLDLCSGLGGASQPALDRGWRVIRIDINPRFKPKIVADVRALPLRPFHVDMLWASPPCQEFSKVGLRCFYPEPPIPDLSLAQAVKRAIDELKPRFWVVENVQPARPFLNTIFGPVACLNPGHAFWGRLPGLIPQTRPHKGSFHKGARWDARERWFQERRERRGLPPPVRTGHNGAGASEVAKIPYEIGEAICRAVEEKR